MVLECVTGLRKLFGGTLYHSGLCDKSELRMKGVSE